LASNGKLGRRSISLPPEAYVRKHTSCAKARDQKPNGDHRPCRPAPLKRMALVLKTRLRH
jgi:hypothetical protein